MYNLNLNKEITAVGSESSGTSRTEFTYDGMDRRIRIVEKTHNGSTWSTGSDNVFVWDRTEIVQKRASDGSTVQRNYFNQGFEEGDNDYFYTKDHLGSIREVVASDGLTIEAVYDYSPWGEVERIGGASSGIESDFLYTGHFFHSKSDLHLTLYRAYDPALGMWLSRDPLESVTGELAELLPEGPNLYVYTGNDPVNWWDPYGEAAFAIPAVIGGGKAALDAIAGGAAALWLIFESAKDLFSNPCDSGCSNQLDSRRNPEGMSGRKKQGREVNEGKRKRNWKPRGKNKGIPKHTPGRGHRRERGK